MASMIAKTDQNRRVHNNIMCRVCLHDYFNNVNCWVDIHTYIHRYIHTYIQNGHRVGGQTSRQSAVFQKYYFPCCPDISFRDAKWSFFFLWLFSCIEKYIQRKWREVKNIFFIHLFFFLISINTYILMRFVEQYYCFRCKYYMIGNQLMNRIRLF